MIPDFDFLATSSMTTLQDLELASRNRAANYFKRIEEIYFKAVAESTAAELARWMIEYRRALPAPKHLPQARPIRIFKKS